MYRFEFPGLSLPSAPVWQSAKGSLVVATDGSHYLDMSMGFGSCIFGHAHQRIINAVSRQCFELVHGMGDLQTSVVRAEALEQICTWAAEPWGVQPHDLRAVVLQSGSEAVETAIKTALLATQRTGIVAFRGSYHGTFGMALAVTHHDQFREPFRTLLPEAKVHFAPYGQVPQLDETVACVIVEPIQGRSGVVMPPPDFLPRLRTACTRAGALLIVDSILVGCGRTGVTLEGAECQPDIIAVGKALGGGIPSSTTIATARVAEEAWSANVPEAIHTSTFLGHPLSCRAATTTIEMLGERNLAASCDPLAATMQQLSDEGFAVRGRGALWAIDTGHIGGGVRLSELLLEELVITVPAGRRGEATMLTPSIEMDQSQLDQFSAALRRLAREHPTLLGASEV